MRHLIVALLFCTQIYAQDSLKVDSILMMHPTKGDILHTTQPERLSEDLDSLNNVYFTDEFILFFYLNDGRVYRIKSVRKTKHKI